MILNQDRIMMISRIIVILICFPVHECAHAWMADRLGDHTGRLRGRISLNPLRHLDYMGTVMLLLAGIGYAKPVPVNPAHFKNRKRDMAITAAAGPLSNLLMAVLFLLIMRAVPMLPLGRETANLVLQLLTYAAYINVSLAIFNLLPIPPLDGSKVLAAVLPDGVSGSMRRYERYAMGILLIALVCLGRMGMSPVGLLTGRVFRFLYQLVL